MVFERDGSNHLRLLAGSRAPLRLVQDVDGRTQLSEATMARTMEALRDFHAIATSVGATRIVAVATAAMRDARNGGLFAQRVQRELGIQIETIGELAEARYGFAGAVRGLAVSNGLLFDLGGGSMQVTRFARRQLVEAVSLPIGALRLSEKFLESDPPTGRQIRRLRDHIQSRLAKARVGRVGSGDCLVGTGGTLRNLAKMDRQTRRYPIGRLHGYELSVDRLGEIVDRLATTREKRRDDIPGLSSERADSIVGGAVAIQTLAEFVRAKHILVSGQGVREGIALRCLKMAVGSPETVKAVVRRAGDRHADVLSLASVRDAFKRGLLDRAATILALADEIEARCPRGRRIAVDCEVGRNVTLSVPLLPSWLAKDLDDRFERVFGRALIIRHHI